MNDLISRQAVLEIVTKECAEFRGMYKRIEDATNDLQSISTCDYYDSELKTCRRSEVPSEWIPVTERLPDEMGMYLVTLDYQEKGKGVVSLWFHNDEIGWNRGWNENVTAWMPLPKPYKAGESE